MNPFKIAYSKMEDIMLDFEGSLATKKDRVRVIIPDTRLSERMEREAVASDLEMKLTHKF